MTIPKGVVPISVYENQHKGVVAISEYERESKKGKFKWIPLEEIVP